MTLLQRACVRQFVALVSGQRRGRKRAHYKSYVVVSRLRPDQDLKLPDLRANDVARFFTPLSTSFFSTLGGRGIRAETTD